ncbi:putative ABC transporter permease [Lactobacillus kalixensis]|uniref:ABC transporter permease n=1 Tax=Lactobacillus kalixensis DSM 16043 TaxID=1423763 RepID=A0A0R1UGB2_9LACO|nr:putative ABC transporter permease [Lactobacillus kalixensis]KRL89797.1 hypothetical protein FC46_GL000528 [Lactobacillus kalixensis DSM 16043]
MPYSLSEIVMLFFTYSVIGWIWETIYCSLKDHHYDYRGFLFGPYCPVYGFAVTTILIFTDKFKNHLILLFISGLIVATIFEYLASLFLEKVFHMKLWDYSDLWGNLQGRVAPMISLFWGFGVVLLDKFIQPHIQDFLNWEEARTHGAFAVIVAVIMATDFVFTIISVERFNVTTKEWNDRINAFFKKRGHELSSHELIFKHLDEVKPKHKLSWNHKRLLNSFPQLKSTNNKQFNDIKQDLVKRINQK